MKLPKNSFIIFLTGVKELLPALLKRMIVGKGSRHWRCSGSHRAWEEHEESMGSACYRHARSMSEASGKHWGSNNHIGRRRISYQLKKIPENQVG